MEEALGNEVDFNKLPPSFEDFPDYVHTSMEIFNALPDMYSGGMSSVYSGKDISALPVLFSLYEIEEQDQKFKIFDIVRFLDGRAKDSAIKEAKKAAERSKKGK